MGTFRPSKKNDSFRIGLIVIASAFFLLCVVGLIKGTVQGYSDREDRIPVYIIAGISAAVAAWNAVALRLQKKRAVLNGQMLMDIPILLLFLFCACFMIVLFVQTIKEAQYGVMVFSVLSFAGFVWSVILWIRTIKARWTVFFVANSKKNREQGEVKLADRLLHSEQLVYINIGERFPFMLEDGAICLFDDITVAQNAVESLAFDSSSSSWLSPRPIEKAKRVTVLQNLYDRGFERIVYESVLGSIDLALESFPVCKSEDPVFRAASAFLQQSYYAQQKRREYTCSLREGRSEEECAHVLAAAAQHTDAAVKRFSETLFYVATVPDADVAPAVLNFSAPAFALCERKGFTHQLKFNGRVTDFVCHSTEKTKPYLDSVPEKDGILRFMIHVFTSYESAFKSREGAKKHLQEWEAETDDEEKLLKPHYWSRLKSLADSDICIMTGKEIIDHCLQTDCGSICVQNEHILDKETIKSSFAQPKEQEATANG